MTSNALLSRAEVAQHNKRGDCWVIIQNKVYDVSSFIAEHPSGKKLLVYAGSDATSASEHIASFPPTAFKGLLDDEAAPVEPKSDPIARLTTFETVAPPVIARPPLAHLLNVYDFEEVAKRVMKKEAWDYYSSGADDEISARENHAAFQRIWLRPRVLVNVRQIDTRSKMLGFDVSMPLYITATALGRLAHPDGEIALARAAASQSIIQMIPTLASCSLEETTGARQLGQVQFFQLYVNSNRKVAEELVKRAENLGCKALCITVDAASVGKRERDMRNKFVAEEPKVLAGTNVSRSQGTARSMSHFIDSGLDWDDLRWFKAITTLPIVLKGIQCGEDAIRAAKYGVQGLILSNHGGRNLDFSRSAIEILPEVMDALRSVGADQTVEVYVDGGIRRGTDIFKALALGAKAVGIGRPSLYGLAGYGQEGVEQVVSLLRDEFEMCMRLMGCPRIEDIKPGMVLAHNLDQHFTLTPKDYSASNVYQAMSLKSKL